MNIANSRALLLFSLICLFSLNLGAFSDKNDGKEDKDNKKDIIIVNLDENLGSQLSGLAQYTYDLYLSKNKGIVTIKKYVDDSGDSKSVDDLVLLLNELGISEENISLKKEELTLENPYFTLSVTSRPQVQ